MDMTLLQAAVSNMKQDLEASVTSATFGGKVYDNGQKAKEALIRSQKLIMYIHEVVKRSLQISNGTTRQMVVHPPIGCTAGELSVTGLIKAKTQDVVAMFDGRRPTPEIIQNGPLAGETDQIGLANTEKSIVIGVRSQLSSVAKNFDTLMERTFAETLNLRLRSPSLVMGEVYLIPAYEYDDVAMNANTVAWKRRPIQLQKFISTFLSISGRAVNPGNDDLYKYERTALVIANFRTNPPRVYTNNAELINDGLLPHNFTLDFSSLSPVNFAQDLLHVHSQRHP